MEYARLSVEAWLAAHPSARLEGPGDLPLELQTILLDAVDRPEWRADPEYDEPSDEIGEAIDPVWKMATAALEARGPAAEEPCIVRIHLDHDLTGAAGAMQERLEVLGKSEIRLSRDCSEVVFALLDCLVRADADSAYKAQINKIAREAWGDE